MLGLLGAVSLSFASGCIAASADDRGDEEAPVTNGVEEKFASDVATLLQFEFDGELTTSQSANATGAIKAQMFFTVGHLNGEPGVSRLDKLVLSTVTTTSLGGGLYRVRYHAKLPVAWGSKTNIPSTYALTLPRRVDGTGQAAYLAKYGPTCNDGEGADMSVSNYWYHYRPRASGCTVAAGDSLNVAATVTTHPGNTYARFPEYHKVWEDGALDVVAIFGKYEVGATSHGDAGISAYDGFVEAVRRAYPSATTVPASIPSNPGVAATDVAFRTTLEGGRVLTITALLVDSVPTVSAAWDKRYNELTAGADLIMYNGHAGLGANVRSLAAKGKFFPGKYQIFYMDGCDTFAYFDGALAATRAKLNSDDPTGTKYMEVITNAMPAYFMNMPNAAMALVSALGNPAAPKSYNSIFKSIDDSQIAVVTGEEDNVYVPTYAPGPRWSGLTAEGNVGKSESVPVVTEVLQPGTYVFSTTGDTMHPGGDADLRVRIGQAPAGAPSTTYKCQSYLYNSNEKCTIKVTTPSRVYLSVTGDSTTRSFYRLQGFQL
ncbi:MAG: hypothetical protein ABI175_07655 [Polyangiales bacterium]